MFRRILFPTDFSEYARRVMDCIAGLPGVLEVVMLHVISSDSPAALRGDIESSARERLESDRALLQSLGISVIKTEVVLSESVPASIDEVAKRHESTIIVMGARGKGLIKGLHLGSVTHRVLHDSHTNLLIMRGQIIERLSGEKFQKFCPMIFSKVLIPVDLTPDSWDVVQKIGKIPEVIEIIVCSVISRGETESEIERIRNKTADALKEKCAQLKTAGAEVRWRILEGDPVSRVLEYADEADVSLVCTVPTEKGIIAELLHGSFSCELARRTSRPVLVIRKD
ncbi:universal stress protein [Methanospirillum sp.]